MIPTRSLKEMNKQYLKDDGMACPYCGSIDIEVVDRSDAPTHYLVECHDCGLRWKDVYKLTGFIPESQ